MIKLKKLQNSVSLKIICYILMPLLVLNIIINTFSITYYDEYKEDIEGQTTYFETERFADEFLRSIYYKANSMNRQKAKEEKNSVIIANEETSIEEKMKTEDKSLLASEDNGINYENYSSKTYDYLIIDESGIAYTNIEKTLNTDSIEELKNYIKAKTYNWYYENNEVNTSIEKMKYENIAYSSYFESIKDSNLIIFASIADENSNQFYKYNLVYKLVSNTIEYASINISISTILLIAMFIYIVISIGHKKDAEGVYTNSLDEIPLEIVGIISIILLGIEILFLSLTISSIVDYISLSNKMVDTMIGLCFTIGILIYATLAITGVTVVRRIKAKVFWKNTLIYKFISWIKRSTSNILVDINTTGKLIVIFGGFTLIQIIAIVNVMKGSFIYVFLLVVLWIISLPLIQNRIKQQEKIKMKIKNIYEGKNDDLP